MRAPFRSRTNQSLALLPVRLTRVRTTTLTFRGSVTLALDGHARLICRSGERIQYLQMALVLFCLSPLSSSMLTCIDRKPQWKGGAFALTCKRWKGMQPRRIACFDQEHGSHTRLPTLFAV